MEDMRKRGPTEAVRCILPGGRETKMEILVWDNLARTARVEVGTARPPRSDYSIFDNARESCLKN
jgi:hypothetical protein